MNSTFRAYAAHRPGAALELSELPRHELPADEVEISVEYCGLCHSDLAMIRNDWDTSIYPLVPGHEVVGTITSAGKNVPLQNIGKRVGVGWYSGSCGYCTFCLSGRQSLCGSRKKTLVGRHGGFASSIRCHWKWATPLPASLPPNIAGPLCCAGLTVYQAILHSRIRPTDRVGVIGIGGLGHLAIQFLKKWGCHVTAFTSNPEKAAKQKTLGADTVIQSNCKQALSVASQSLDWILCTSPAAIDTSTWLDLLAPGGTLHFVGIPSEPLSLPIPALLAQKSITASTPGGPGVMTEMLKFAARHHIQPLIEELPLSQINEAIVRLEKGDVRYRFVLRNDL